MATPNPNSPEVLSEEILAAAKRDCDRILRLAQKTAESYLARANAEVEKIRNEKLDAARAEAARRSELTLSTVPLEVGRLRAGRIEALLENIYETARRQLESRDFDCREMVIALAAEAIGRMPGRGFVLKLSVANHAAFGDKLADEISQHVGLSLLKLTIMADPTMADGGVIVQDIDGRRFWDNRLQSRLERLWPELRRKIAVQTGLVETTGGPA